MQSARPSAEGSLFPALALETSTRPGSVALALSEEDVVFLALPGGGDLSSHLVPALDRLTAGAGLEPGDIRLIVLGTGPGSFTGLRSGAAAAAVLAAYIPASLVTLPSLEGSPILTDHRNVALCLEALRGEVQGEIFREGVPVSPPFLASLEEFASRLEGGGVLAGNAAFRLAESGLLPSGWSVPAGEEWIPRADHLLKRGLAGARKGTFTAPEEISLLYLRPSAAVEKRRRGS